MGASQSYVPWRSESIEVASRLTQSGPLASEEGNTSPDQHVAKKHLPTRSDPTGFVRNRLSLGRRSTLRRKLTSTVVPESGVPTACCWPVYRVGEWISNVGYPQYKLCFTSNYIDGRKLIYFRDISNFPKIGVYDFEHMKVMESSRQPLHAGTNKKTPADKQLRPPIPAARFPRPPAHSKRRPKGQLAKNNRSSSRPEEKRLTTGGKFSSTEAESIIRSVFHEELGGETEIAPTRFAELSIKLCNSIRSRMKSLNLTRYKIVCHVTLGQKQGQGIHVKSRSIWDHSCDSYAEAVYDSGSTFIVATVFGVYFE